MRDSDLSYQEILSCLEDAKQGLLSPYWQNYAKRELDTLRDQDGALPPDAKILAEQLQALCDICNSSKYVINFSRPFG
jgi:hypothetical protein